jgi:hypothetical protein
MCASAAQRLGIYHVTQGEILIAMKEFNLAATILEAALLINPNVSNDKELLERAKRGRYPYGKSSCVITSRLDLSIVDPAHPIPVVGILMRTPSGDRQDQFFQKHGDGK